MATTQNPLSEYNRKRDFSRTAEPKGKAGAKTKARKLFLIQKHDATRLHYDFRLEWKGVLKSWAVTRGPSIDPHDKRLAVRTEDHPMAYGDFEGTIPKKQYGGGTVMLWDTGWWEPVEDFDAGLKDGKLKFRLHGERLTGAWTLIRMKPRDGEKRENWLLIKEHDEIADDDGESILTDNITSVKTGRTMEEIAAGKGETAAHVWQSSKSAAANVKAGAIAPEPKVKKTTQTGKAPAFAEPQLATLVGEPPEGDDWLSEVKFDGYRLLVSIGGGGGVTCYTRTGLDWTEKFPDIVEAFSGLDCKSALIDGEAVAVEGKGSKFSALQQALKDGGHISYYAFDLLELDGKDLRKKPLMDRKELLKQQLEIADNAIVKYSEHVRGQSARVFEAMCKSGQEGIIAKRVDAPYRSGRTGGWLKVKCTRRQEFVIGGYSPSDKKGRPFASLLVGTFENDKLVYQGRVGTGFNERVMEELAELFAKSIRKTSPFINVPAEFSRGAVWLKPELVAEVEFAELTDDGHIRHGSFQGLRRDKDAKAVVLESEKAKKTNADKPVLETASLPMPGKKAAPKKRAKNVSGTVAGIAISHPERVLFKDVGLTKLDLAEYYDSVSSRMLVHAADHPVSLLRCPGGDIAHCFFQKHAGDGFPGAIGAVPIKESSGDTENYMVIKDAAGLIAAVQMGTMEFHIWGSSARQLEKPDRLIFDLDPDPSVTFEDVKTAAVELRDILEAVGLQSVPMVTGGKGVHVIVPLQRRAEWDDAKAFAKGLANKIADARPERYVATMSKAQRKGRIFIDWLRNERGATAVAPYSIRARANAPVATPVTWDELATLIAANSFRTGAVIERLQEDDPWAETEGWKQSITKDMVHAVSD